MSIQLVDFFPPSKPMVWYKKPQETSIKGLVQKNSKVYDVQEFSTSGFVMCPFENNQNGVLIPKQFADAYEIPVSDIPTHFTNELDQKSDPIAYQKHLDLVQKTIDFIQEGKAQKIVISRSITLDFDFQKTISVFEKLCFHYPDALVYLWFHPQFGLWMGATPERLVTLEHHEFTTMSLAGTQLFTENLIWQEKEKQEQKELSETFTKKAGLLAHLCTMIQGRLNPENNLSDLINQLHPTPAVCGTPRIIAKQFIWEHEGYNREFYTGFLGEINPLGKSEVFVNLRCMKILENQVQIFVGGGITDQSNPELEWLETVHKSKVLGKFISS
jgi:isochorismate synthase